MYFSFLWQNIESVIGKCSTELGCDASCVLDNQIAAAFSLGMSLIIFQILPIAVKKLLKILKQKQEHTKKVREPDW